AVLEATLGEERKALLENLQEGFVIKGIVKNITDYGAFVDLGGIDGLLHITDLAWRRVKHPSEVLEVGQEVEAKVLKFDQDKQRVSLGMKQLGEDPWSGLTRRYP
ncbi:S1 RNA-binding domain-containing protein, partial [Klebsiella pneumoniae]|nr:S1 RNA-binding domain-containing protein [Klebsiella pneumoniae]